MQKKVRAAGSSTMTPLPWRESSSPSVFNREIASRTTDRLTPKTSLNWDSGGSFAPGT